MNNNIKKYRIEKEMTLEELSKLCNLSIGYISHLETGKRDNPSYKTMKSIANALNKDISNLFI